MLFALIGMGEVGRCYARPLKEAGYDLVLCDPRPSTASQQMADEWGIPIHQSIGEWVKEANWVISCVTGSHALAVVEQALAHIGSQTRICDMTTASPTTKRTALALCEKADVAYVDTAIMGAISLSLIKTPLLSAGKHADEFSTLLEKAGGKVTVIQDGKAGDAISLKILRSIFTKGMEALSVEMLMAAETQGVREKLFELLSDIDNTPLRTFINMLVRTHVIHAKRRAHEVHDAAEELASHGLPSAVLPGIEARFQKTIASLESTPVGEDDPSIDTAIQWLLTTSKVS
ncbi:NAD(P)-binding domain-containing protein [Rhodoferax sp. GW822-FHT02A01]|uniref:NAD(P)-binding domain-containing protein n=1 Tax=Rhodoferax sp. GW822-FHT02A01 TaxID=3141537 RepID=UPI00315D9500